MGLLTPFVEKVYAAAPMLSPVGDPNSSDTNGVTAINNLYTSVLNVLLLLAGILAVLYLIWAGIMYITSAGDAERAKKGKAGIINAIIGIVIIVAAYAIIRFSTSVGRTVSCADNPSQSGCTSINLELDTEALARR